MRASWPLGEGLPKTRAKEAESAPSMEQPKRQERDIYCYTCREKGHMSFKCPNSTGLYSDENCEPRRPVERPTSGEVYRSGRVKDISVADIVLDTGASRTLVWEDLVPPCAISNGEVAIRCAHRNAISYPLAEIKITVGVRGADCASSRLQDSPGSCTAWMRRPETGTKKPTMGDPVLMLATTTWAQVRTQQQEESQTEERMRVSGATPSKSVFFVQKQILTDQGSNFTSQLLAVLYHLLHIKPIRMSPYHPYRDGLVEIFNQTLKAMLHRTADEEGKDSDRLIPYFLFAWQRGSTGIYQLLALRTPLWSPSAQTPGYPVGVPRGK